MWKYNNKVLNKIPEGAVGFIYRVDNLTNGKFYIGKKDFFSKTNPEISKKKYDELKALGEPVVRTKNKKLSSKDNVVWRYKQKNLTKETDWCNYCGSNADLKEDVKKGHLVEKTILRICYTKTELTYREIEQIIKHDCLDLCDSYNGNILSKFFKQVKC